MADISIHNVKTIEIEKYPLTNTFICRIRIISESRMDKTKIYETITLFSDEKETYDSFIEVDK